MLGYKNTDLTWTTECMILVIRTSKVHVMRKWKKWEDGCIEASSLPYVGENKIWKRVLLNKGLT
jgi:hypothetical protein